MLYVFEELFNMCNGCLVLFQCKLALDAVKAKSRRGSWVLIKRVALLMLGHVFFYLLIFAVRFIGMWVLLADFEKLEMEEGRIKRKMIEVSDRIIVMVTADKLDTVDYFKICDFDDVDVLIIEDSADEEKLGPYRDLGIQVI